MNIENNYSDKINLIQYIEEKNLITTYQKNIIFQK